MQEGETTFETLHKRRVVNLISFPKSIFLDQSLLKISCYDLNNNKKFICSIETEGDWCVERQSWTQESHNVVFLDESSF